MLTPKQLAVMAEIVGFLATLALIYQTVRLLRHQKSVRDMRATAEKLKALKAQATPGDNSLEKTIKLAEEGAEILEKTIAQWDKRDRNFVFVGLGGLMLSFGLKLWGLALE